jgi:hypothetical protein
MRSVSLLVATLLALGCGARSELGGPELQPGDAAGVDGVAPPPPPSNGLAQPACGPTDGPALAVAVTEVPVTCADLTGGMPPAGVSTAFLLPGVLTSASAGTSFPVNANGTGAFVARCQSGGMCHMGTAGSIVVDRLVEGSEITLHWSVTLDDGSAATGQARVTIFCPMTTRCG